MDSMRAIAHGGDGKIESMQVVASPRPVPHAGQILIEVHAAGVNRPDVMQRAGKYPPPPDASPVLGLEVAGTVAAVGEGVSEWRVGDAVMALTPGGGYAEYCLAPANNAIAIPAGMSMTQAAGIPETWFTVWANVGEMAQLKPGERILIHGGSSGIGLTAIQFAKQRGAEAIVTVGSPDKAKFCEEFGATAAIDYRREDFLERTLAITGRRGVDVVLDMVGAPYAQKNLAVLARDGRLVIIAFLQGSRGEIDLMPVMLKRLTVTGSTMRPRSVAEKATIRDALVREIAPAWAAGRLMPHIHARFALEHAGDAHRLMESSAHIGKIVLDVKA